MTVPHDPLPFASTSSWADALPIDDDRYADALDTWLEHHSAMLRTGGASSPAEPHTYGQNGTTDRADAGTDAASSAPVVSAERFHRRLEAAERAAPPVPEDAIWEKIMTSHLALPSPAQPLPPSRATNRVDDPASRPMRTIIGSHPALSVIMAAAVVIAMIALFRGLSDDGNVIAPTDPTGTDNAHLAAIASPSPITSPDAPASPIAADPWLQPITASECAVPPKTSSDGELAERAYTLTGTPERANAQAVAKSSRELTACGRDNAIASSQFSTHRATTDDKAADRAQAISQELSNRGAPPVYRRTGEDTEFPQSSRIREYSEAGVITYTSVFVPEDAIEFSDGRVGVPTTYLIGDAASWSQIQAYTSRSTVLNIWVPTGSTWKLDETLPLCFGDCDAFWATYAQVTSTSIATPSGTAMAADPWLQPITASECAPVTTSDEVDSDTDAVATTARHFLACGRYETIPDAMIPFLSADFLARHPELTSGQFTVHASDVTEARVISSILIAQGSYTPYVKGLPGADDETDVTQGFYEVFLPQSAIRLDDGRIGIPIKIAFGSDDELNATTQATDSGAPMTVAMYVFAPANGAWQVDQQLLLCVENCDLFWQGQEASIGKPYPSDEELATAAASATAEAAWLQPITADECVLPTQKATADPELPDRVYRPLLKPTTDNAEEVATTARNITACVVSEPNHSPNIAARFMTDRMKARYVNRDVPIGNMLPEDIDAAQAVSQQIESRGVPDLYKRAPKDAATPEAHGDIFGSVVFEPANTYQFTDGRIGILSTLVTVDSAFTITHPEGYTLGSISIYAPVGEQWKLDQTLDLCFGDCDAYWQERQDQAATPAAAMPTAVSAATASQDCITIITDDDISRLTTESATWPDPAYVPTQGPASPTDAQAAITTYLANNACRFQDDRPYKYQARTLQTDRANLAASLAYTSAADYADMLAMSNQLSQELSPLLLDADPAAYIVDERDLAGTDAVVLSEWSAEGMQQVIFPEDFVTLADGRIGVPVKSIRTSSQGDDEMPAFIPVRFLTFAQVDGQWLVDESPTLCSGDCAPFYEEIGAYIDTVRSAPATPSSDVATPESGSARMPGTAETAANCGDRARSSRRAGLRDRDRSAS